MESEAQTPETSASTDRILRGGAALTLRQALSLPLNAAGLWAASLWLVPADFGVLAILATLIAGAFAVVDLGFTNALIQSSHAPSVRILRRIQLYKLAAALFTIALYYLLAHVIGSHFRLPASYLLLFPACGFVAWLQSERGHQSVLFQRSVDWPRLAAIEVVEIAVYNVCLGVTAYLFRSPSCFVLAMSARAAVGTVLLKVAQLRVPKSPGTSGDSLRSLLRFGVPYQATTVLSMIQKSLNPVIVGSVAGVGSAGLVNWSNYVASVPLLPLQPMYGFLFSVLSERQRQQRHSDEAIKTIVRIGATTGTFLSLAMALLLPTAATHFLQPQWAKAIPVATLLLVGNSLTVPSAIITTYLTARGFSEAWMRIVILETVLVWLLGIAGLIASGIIGYVIGLMLATAIVLVVERIVLDRLTGVKIGWSDAFAPALLAVGTVALSAGAGRLGLISGPFAAVVPFLVGSVAFVGLAYFDIVRGLKKDIATVFVSVAGAYRRDRLSRSLNKSRR